jgi:hypothetical protein
MSYDRIAKAVHGAVGAQTKSHIAKVVGAVLPNGTVQCFSETLGNMSVIFRTTEDVKVGDWVYVYRAGPESHAPWMYGGFAAGDASETRPPISRDTKINVAAPADGSGTVQQDTTLQVTLDTLSSHVRSIQGTSTWKDAPGTSLANLVTWRSPVASADLLPSTGNRLGDVRVVLATSTLYLWGASGWRSPAGGSVPVGAITAVVTLAGYGIGAFTLLAVTTAGGVAASATNADHVGCLVGMTLESAGAGQDVLVQLSGEVVLPSAPTAQGPVFLGSNGGFASRLITGVRFAQSVGVVVGSKLLLAIDPTIVILDSVYIAGIDSGTGSGTDAGTATAVDAAVDARLAAWGYAGTVGDGFSTSIAVTHNLGTRDVQVSLYLNSGSHDVEYPTIQITSINLVTLVFRTAPASAAYRVTVQRVR